MAHSKYSIVQVPHDEEGIQEYIKRYRDFRLLSLQLAPEAFASTYARELAFSNEVWYGRFANLAANTFLAVEDEDSDSGRIVSTSTLMGPLPYGPDAQPPLGNPWTAIQNQSEIPALDEKNPLHFRVNAVFTLPDARRRGLSKALIEKSVEFAETQMSSSPNPSVVISVLVESENIVAKALYEKCGFKVVRRVDQEPPHPGHAESPGVRSAYFLEYRCRQHSA